MTVIATSNISTTDLNSIKCQLEDCYACATYKVAKANLYALPCNDSCIAKELFLYEYILSSWEQNTNGTTTGYFNYITLDQLTNIINRIKQICGC